MTPTVGRIVHYMPQGPSGPWAAIVTAVNPNDTVDLTVFPSADVMVAFRRVDEVPESDEADDGPLQPPKTWRWPPRA